MTPVMAQDLRRAVIERDGSVQLNASYERSIGQYKLINEAQERKVGLLLDQNDKLSLRLGEERTSSFWEKTGYFALGIIATVGAGWALGQVQK